MKPKVPKETVGNKKRNLGKKKAIGFTLRK